MRESYQNPCQGCGRLCNYTQCRDYRLWLNRCWNRYRRWPEQWQRPAAKEKDRFFRYDSPVLLRDYLENGPCQKCPARICCSNLESCEAYEAWVRLRWENIRKRLGSVAQ